MLMSLFLPFLNVHRCHRTYSFVCLIQDEKINNCIIQSNANRTQCLCLITCWINSTIYSYLRSISAQLHPVKQTLPFAFLVIDLCDNSRAQLNVFSCLDNLFFNPSYPLNFTIKINVATSPFCISFQEQISKSN